MEKENSALDNGSPIQGEGAQQLVDGVGMLEMVDSAAADRADGLLAVRAASSARVGDGD